MKRKRRVPKVIRKPGFALKRQGRRHAEQGIEVCNMHIEAWSKKEEAIFAGEIKTAQEDMRETVTLIKEALNEITLLEDKHEQTQNDDIKNRSKSQISALKREIMKKLFEVEEEDTILRTRLWQINDELNSKLNFYKAGATEKIAASRDVNHNGPAFSAVTSPDSYSRYQEYKNEHKKLVESIGKPAGKADTSEKKGGVEDEAA